MSDSGYAPRLDPLLAFAVCALLGLGFIAMSSASIASATQIYDQPFHYAIRQAMVIAVGVALGFLVYITPLRVWETTGPILFAIGLVLLAAVFAPGIGKSVNGSSRWLHLGPVNIQVAEFIKLVVVIYLAGYLTRHLDKVRSTMRGFVMPILLLSVVAVLLLAQPDFGTTVVIFLTALGVLLLAGARIGGFLVLAAVCIAALVALAFASPYRLQRLTAFLDPWAHPYDSGFQLTQALIAFGNGEWFGVGLGSGVQKLFYLPEAHTDFVLAVLAEELGFVGVLCVIALFVLLAWRCLVIARKAEKMDITFGGFLCYGVGLWLALQSFINIGVNMGALPTKGITLPLMSYGGSSMLITLVALGLVFRVDREVRKLESREIPMGLVAGRAAG